MGNWYIRRGDQQYGPYTKEQMISMESNGQLLIGDVIYDSIRNLILSLDQAHFEWHSISQRYPQVAVNNQTKRKHVFRNILLFGEVVIIIGGALYYYFGIRNNTSMKLGIRQQWGQASIITAGGTITVEDTNSPIKGMTIKVASGTYKSNLDFSISTRSIKSHSFGSKFTPVTPLISIDNGHVFTNIPMKVNIPITKADDEFAMAFYYDEATGKLEGIPSSELDNKHITLVTNHFSDIVNIIK